MNARAPVTSCSGRLSCGPQRAIALTFRSSVGSAAPFTAAARPCCQTRRHQSLQVQNALSRVRKEETVELLCNSLQSSAVVFGVRFKNIGVKDMDDFRQTLPAETKMVVCKNTLMRLAADRVEGWSDLRQATLGENAWMFVPEEAISESVKAYMEFEKKLTARLPREERGKILPTTISGGVMDRKFIDEAQVRRLEKMPTKKELIATIARLIKQVPTRVAVSIKQVPTKLAIGVKALADGDDNKELIVGDVFPKADSA